MPAPLCASQKRLNSHSTALCQLHFAVYGKSLSARRPLELRELIPDDSEKPLSPK
jgi:hypothetical protein